MKRHMFWFAELIVWALILVIVSGGIMLAKINYKKNFNTYQMFLPDVDGLIVGSPVKYLGIQIGYINQIDIVGEDVYVKFVLTQKNLKLPRGTIATVEFSGLGGSKSLELYPPKAEALDSANKLIVTQDPKRIHDSMGLLMRMFQDLSDITYDVSHFIKETGVIEASENFAQQQKTNSAKKVIDNSNTILDGLSDKCAVFSEKLNNQKRKNDAKKNK